MAGSLPFLPMRRLAIFCILAIALAPTASATDLASPSATGSGRFELGGTDALLHSHDPSQWEVSAAKLTVTLVDDSRSNQIPNPADPENLLYSEGNHTTSTQEFRNARLTFGHATEPDTVAILSWHPGRAAWNGLLQGDLGVRAISSEVLETSHYTSRNTTSAQRYYYEIRQGPSLRVDLSGEWQADIEGDVRIYLWGTEFQVESRRGLETYTTGTSEERPVTGSAVGQASHYVYAYIDAKEAWLTLPNAAARMYAATMEIASSGTLSMTNATGAIAVDAGLNAFHDASVVLTDGAYALHLEDAGLGLVVQDAPKQVNGGRVIVDDGSGFGWTMFLLVGGVLGAVVYATPTMEGLRVRRREVLDVRGWKLLRGEGYASLASRLDAGGRFRAASLAAWLATRCMPQDPDAHMECGVMLLNAGQARRALRRFERAHYLAIGQWSNAGLNAMHACRASAALGKDSFAMAWLQAAVEADPGLADWAAHEPLLGRLREHPDFEAIVGKPIQSR